jgi:hypothetical protein
VYHKFCKITNLKKLLGRKFQLKVSEKKNVLPKSLELYQRNIIGDKKVLLMEKCLIKEE